MDKFFNSTFDALTNVLPGAVIIISLFLATPNLSDLVDTITTKSEIGLLTGAVFIFASYIVGFTISPIGKFLYTKIGSKMFNLVKSKNSDITITEKHILVREFSATNFKYIETWNMFCTLSHNLAVGLALTCLISNYRIAVVGDTSSIFIILSISSLIMFFLCINRAVTFKNWAISDMDAAIEKLHLVEKAKPSQKTFKILLEDNPFK